MPASMPNAPSNALPNNAKAMIGKTLMHVMPKSIKVMAKKYLAMIQTSPALGIIYTPENSIKDWFNTGVKFEWLSLLATSNGISVSPMAALIERPGSIKLMKVLISRMVLLKCSLD